MADDTNPPDGELAPLVLHIEPDQTGIDAAIERSGRSLARITAAVHAVADLSGRSSHSQRCPVWLGRAKNVGLDRCNCWIVRDAQRVVTTVLTALGGQARTTTDNRGHCQGCADSLAACREEVGRCCDLCQHPASPKEQ